jgi:hypothetical protein
MELIEFRQPLPGPDLAGLPHAAERTRGGRRAVAP